MGNLDVVRVVSLYAEAVDRSGSGYLITPSVLLTSAHCVGPVGSPVEVLALKRGRSAGSLDATPPADFRVAAVSSASPNGLALLESRQADPFGPGEVAPVRWGYLAGMLPLPAETMGFPELAITRGRLNAEHAVGKLIPFAGAREINPDSPETSSLAFHVESGSPDVNVGGGALWRGASGAAVFSESHLVGVLNEYQPHMRGRLMATPVSVLEGNSAILGFLRKHIGKEVRFEPVWTGDEILDPAYSALDDGWSAADLLRARYSVVPFSGREKELRRLIKNWCVEDHRRTSILLLTGNGAVGKTRLARELCDRMIQHGWVAGLLTSSVSGMGRLRDLNEDRLVVVDDADVRVGQVDMLLRTRQGRSKLRVLAIARNPGDWWKTIERRYDKLIADSLKLEPPNVPERERVYRSARDTFYQLESGRITGAPDGSGAGTSAALPEAVVPTELADPDFESYLFVLILALTDVYRQLHPAWAKSGLPPSATRAEGLLEQVLDLERKDWVAGAKDADLPADPVLLERIVAVASLAYAGCDAGGRGESEAASRLRMVPDLADASEYTRRRFVRMFRERIAGYDALRPLRPQRLAEHLTAKVICQFPEIASQLLAPPGDPSTSSCDAARQALNSLRLLSADFDKARSDELPWQASDEGVSMALHDALREHAPYVIGLAQQVLDNPDKVTARSLAAALVAVFSSLRDNQIAASAAAKLEEACPDELLALAVVLQKKAIDFYEAQPENLENRASLGNAHKCLSIALADSGSRRKAYDHAWQALEYLNSVVRADNCDKHVLEKAHALTNLAVREYDVGKFEGSVEHGRDAVHLYEDLMRRTPDRMHHVHLGFALRNLSQSLAQLGRSREALQTATEALDLVERELPVGPGDDSAKSPAITAAKALSLRELAHRQADVGRYREALASAERARDLYQALMSKPGRWRRDLARSLDVLGRRYADAGQWEQSVTTLRRARDEYNRVEQEYQEAERGKHAELLRDLASSYLGWARTEPSVRDEALREGRKAADDALTHYEHMFKWDRIVQRAQLGQTLRVRAELALEGREAGAPDYARRAVQILRDQVADRSWKGRRDLARAHAVYARVLALSGDYLAAVSEGREACTIFRELDAEEPERLTAELQSVEEDLKLYENP